MERSVNTPLQGRCAVTARLLIVALSIGAHCEAQEIAGAAAIGPDATVLSRSTGHDDDVTQSDDSPSWRRVDRGNASRTDRTLRAVNPAGVKSPTDQTQLPARGIRGLLQRPVQVQKPGMSPVVSSRRQNPAPAHGARVLKDDAGASVTSPDQPVLRASGPRPSAPVVRWPAESGAASVSAGRQSTTQTFRPTIPVSSRTTFVQGMQVRQNPPPEVGVVQPAAWQTEQDDVERPPVPAPAQIKVPLAGGASEGVIKLDRNDGLISLSVRDAPLRDVLGVLAQSQGLNILTTDDVDTNITGTFTDISFEDAMDSVFAITGYTWVRRRNVILVTPINGENRPSHEAQGREVRVFPLNFVSASDVQKVVTTLLSPSGQIVITETDANDHQKTCEHVIVEDLPGYLERVAGYITEIDTPPRQVLIEAHILQVDLKGELSHGVDFAKLSKIAGTDVLISTPSFNNTVTSLSTLSTPSYNIGILNEGSFAGLIEALVKTNDAKTLASPKVLALNGQEAHVQVGQKLGYFVTTTTQTSTLQSVEFIDTGIVLKVTPRITSDGQILMSVKPEVSDGSVDALGLPSERTTEVDTTIMLADGKGMVIGGLIKEVDVESQQKVPVLGSIWLVGKLFRHTNVVRERSEIIIVLVPHIMPDPRCECRTDEGVARATTPLLNGPLHKFPRPWEPEFPDAVRNPRRFDSERALDFLRRPDERRPGGMEYYFPLRDGASSDSLILESMPVYETPPMPGPPAQTLQAVPADSETFPPPAADSDSLTIPFR